MKLRVFLPATESLDPAAALAWLLRDARGGLLREGRSALDAMPGADEVEAVLPVERVLFARLALPKVNAATIRELLPYAVEDRLLADPAQIHAVSGARNARGETLVAVVDRGYLRRMRDALARAGRTPRRAWCESALLAGGRGDWHIVLGAARGMLVDDDGVGVPFDRSPGLPLALRVALDEAAGRGERPQAILVHAAGDAALPPLEAWSAEANLAFRAGDPWEVVARGDPAADAIDLLQGERHEPRRAVRIPRAVAALACTAAVLQLAFTAGDAWRLQRERDALEARREAVFREAFPEARTVVDPDLQMARNLADLQRSRGLAAGDEFLVELTRLAHAKPRVQAIEYAQGKVSAR